MIYRGLCIAGPLAGKIIESRYVVYTADHHLTLADCLDVRPSNYDETSNYRFHKTSLDIGIFVHETINFDQAIATILLAYQEKMGG